MPVPNLGRFGSIGVGKQTVLGTQVVPSVFFRWNGASTPGVSAVRTRDNYANASIHTMPERVHGRTWQNKSFTFEAEHTGIQLLLELICAANAAAGVITPLNGNWADNFPMMPATIEWNYPNEPVRAKDVQFYGLQLSMNNRSNFTGTANFHGIDAVAMPTGAATAVLPSTNIYSFRDHYMQLSGVNINPESSSLNLNIPIQAIDAARGNQAALKDLILGFERNGAVVLSGQFTVAGLPAAQRTAYLNGTYAPLRFGLSQGSKLIEFVVPNAEFNTVEIPGTLDRLATPVSWTAVSVAGETPFTINVA